MPSVATVLFARSARDGLERKMPHFVSNKYRLVAENSCWCLPRNQQRAVTPTRPSVQARTRAIAPKRLRFIERYRNTGRRSWRISKREAASCLHSCLTSLRLTFAVASLRTAFFASDVKTVGTAESWRSRVSGADFARAVLVAAWPTQQLSVWITFSPKCLPGNTSSRYPMPCASRWPIRPTPRAWCLAHSSAPSTRTSAAAHGSASFVVGCRPEA